MVYLMILLVILSNVYKIDGKNGVVNNTDRSDGDEGKADDDEGSKERDGDEDTDDDDDDGITKRWKLNNMY